MLIPTATGSRARAVTRSGCGTCGGAPRGLPGVTAAEDRRGFCRARLLRVGGKGGKTFTLDVVGGGPPPNGLTLGIQRRRPSGADREPGAVPLCSHLSCPTARGLLRTGAPCHLSATTHASTALQIQRPADCYVVGPTVKMNRIRAAIYKRPAGGRRIGVRGTRPSRARSSWRSGYRATLA